MVEPVLTALETFTVPVRMDSLDISAKWTWMNAAMLLASMVPRVGIMLTATPAPVP